MRPALILILTLAVAARAQDDAPTTALRGLVHVGDGQTVIADGVVLLRGARIVAVGPWAELSGQVPEGARLVTVAGAELTPGLIDAASTVGVASPGSFAEQGSEVVPHLRVLDEVDLHEPGWRRLAARGVTTVCVTASPESVIGSRTALVRTAGRLEARVISQEGAVKATLGPEAWRRGASNRRPFGGIDFLVRRPTTRMGGVWVFRDAFARARVDQLEGPAGEALRAVLRGDVALRIQARTRGDIETALRLTAEAEVPRVILEEATEARYLLPLLVERRVAVIFGPLFDRPRGWRAFTGEGSDPALGTPGLLHRAGVPFCLTAADQEGEDDLAGQAMLATRYGLDPELALAAVTSSPAALLGLEHVGALRAGLSADVVLWSGPPLEPTSRPLLVFIQGAAVVDRAAPPPPPRRATPPRSPQRF